MEELVIEDGRGDAKTAETLLREYMRGHLDEIGARLGVDLSVSDALSADLLSLHEHGNQDWGMLLARDDTGAPVGCVVLRSLGDDMVEMRHLYVRPHRRGAGLGRRLAEAALAAAELAGATTVRLTVNAAAETALHLYAALGFHDIGPYLGAEITDPTARHWVFLERRLRNA